MTKKKTDVSIRSSAAEYLTYVASTGDSSESVEMRYEDENIWLTQNMMAALYDVDVRTINYHIKKIFADSELLEDSVIRKFRITADDGKAYLTNHYSLQMIIAVGFKVNSQRAVQFRKWVNKIAATYTIKGWVMDEDRLKYGGTVLTKQYFEEQLEKIREIRASERMFYQKITDLYATAIDYDRNAQSTRRFYATVPTMTASCWKWKRSRKRTAKGKKKKGLWNRRNVWSLYHQSKPHPSQQLFNKRFELSLSEGERPIVF